MGLSSICKESVRIKIPPFLRTLDISPKILFLIADGTSWKVYVEVTISKDFSSNGSSSPLQLTKFIFEYFFNLSITAVAITNKIYSSRGTLINKKNLLNAKSSYPKHKDAIERVFKKFE